MPRKPAYVVIVYRDGSRGALVGYGGFLRMVWQAVLLVCRCRWDRELAVRDLPLEVHVLLQDVMDPEHPPKVMH